MKKMLILSALLACGPACFSQQAEKTDGHETSRRGGSVEQDDGSGPFLLGNDGCAL